MAYVVSTPRKASDEGDDEYEWPVLQAKGTMVYESSEPTGILDPHGNEIHRVNDPIGFRFTENDTQ